MKLCKNLVIMLFVGVVAAVGCGDPAGTTGGTGVTSGPGTTGGSGETTVLIAPGDEGTYCDKQFKCKEGLVCLDEGQAHGDARSPIGRCEKVESCENNDSCAKDPQKPSCIYKWDVEQKIHKVCGQCGSYNAMCANDNDACVYDFSKKGKDIVRVCKSSYTFCVDKSVCAPGQECVRFSDMIYGGGGRGEEVKVCTDPKKDAAAGFYEGCGMLSGGETSCDEKRNLICIADIEEKTKGRCSIECTVPQSPTDVDICTSLFGAEVVCRESEVLGASSGQKKGGCIARHHAAKQVGYNEDCDDVTNKCEFNYVCVKENAGDTKGKCKSMCGGNSGACDVTKGGTRCEFADIDKYFDLRGQRRFCQ